MEKENIDNDIAPINNANMPARKKAKFLARAFLCNWLRLSCLRNLGLLYAFVYIAWATGVLVILAIMAGYALFNLKMDVKGYILSLTIAIVELVATIFITIAIALSVELSISLCTAFSSMFELIASDSAVQEALLKDILLTLFMLIAGYIGFIIAQAITKRQQKKQLAKLAYIKTPKTEDITGVTVLEEE